MLKYTFNHKGGQHVKQSNTIRPSNVRILS